MATHDPTSQKASAQAGDLTTAQKVDGALELTKQVGTAMFTSRTTDGKLASRAMIPASTENHIFSFFFNRDSGKADDVKNDDQVNLAFLNPKTGDWVSIAGNATIVTDRSRVKKHWSSSLKAWFDDKGDGKHTGDENDPRVALIDVRPEEIRWFKADGKIRFLVETAQAALTGKGAAAGGKLVVITSEELDAHSKVHTK